MRCNSCSDLEIDHVQPYADNGPPTAANLRLLCRAHNQEHARRYFGKSYIRAAIVRARARAAQLKSELSARRTTVSGSP